MTGFRTFICEQCGQKFRAPSSARRRGWARFCSINCSGRWLRPTLEESSPARAAAIVRLYQCMTAQDVAEVVGMKLTQVRRFLDRRGIVKDPNSPPLDRSELDALRQAVAREPMRTREEVIASRPPPAPWDDPLAGIPRDDPRRTCIGPAWGHPWRKAGRRERPTSVQPTP